MPFAIRASVDIRDALRRLNGLKQGKRNAILRTAATKSARLVLASAKANLRTRTKLQKKLGITRHGILLKSLGVKIASYEHTVVALIGPRKGFKEQIGVRTRDGKHGKKGDPIYEDPTKIAHLVEYGHGGPGKADEHPFMRPAWYSNEAKVKRIYEDEISKGLAKLASSGAL